jgi:hypothetical protein
MTTKLQQEVQEAVRECQKQFPKLNWNVIWTCETDGNFKIEGYKGDTTQPNENWTSVYVDVKGRFSEPHGLFHYQLKIDLTSSGFEAIEARCANTSGYHLPSLFVEAKEQWKRRLEMSKFLWSDL